MGAITSIPQTGLIGSEQALQAGYGQGREDLLGTFGVANAAVQPVQSALASFVPGGIGANQQQAALSGALGGEAQRQAFTAFNESPGQAFLRQQAERAVTRNAAATGGLGGGRVLQELQRQAVGLAQQDFQNQFDRLGQVSNTGLQALNQQGSLAGQQAQIAAALGGQLGNMSMTAGQNLAQGRTQAGQAIAGNVAQTSGNIAELLRQQGVDVSQLIGQGGSNVAGLIQAASQAQAAGNIELATLLANIATGSASQRVGLPSLPGVQQEEGMLGGIGSFLGGAGTAYQAFSDIRLKANIRQVGALDSGLGIYVWEWTEEAKGLVGGQRPLGVLAQEAIEIIPDAVTIDESGYLIVDYTKVH